MVGAHQHRLGAVGTAPCTQRRSAGHEAQHSGVLYRLGLWQILLANLAQRRLDAARAERPAHQAPVFSMLAQGSAGSRRPS